MGKYINKVKAFVCSVADCLKEYLESLSPQAKRKMVLTMFALYTVVAILIIGKAVYDMGRDKGRKDIMYQLFLREERSSLIINKK